jgi:hypothetical protein
MAAYFSTSPNSRAQRASFQESNGHCGDVIELRGIADKLFDGSGYRID